MFTDQCICHFPKYGEYSYHSFAWIYREPAALLSPSLKVKHQFLVVAEELGSVMKWLDQRALHHIYLGSDNKVGKESVT